MKYPNVNLYLPDWIEDFPLKDDLRYPTCEKQMECVIGLAQKNIEHKTGGPFGAGLFEHKTGRLIAPGVNCVESLNCSIAHAEIIAITIAQSVSGSYDLSRVFTSGVDLVTSTEPCAMCLGAIGWSGVRRVVCAARDEDARAIGFDEGAKPEDWVGSLEARGIHVRRDIMRDQARAVLLAYRENGGLIYNAHHEKLPNLNTSPKKT